MHQYLNKIEIHTILSVLEKQGIIPKHFSHSNVEIMEDLLNKKDEFMHHILLSILNIYNINYDDAITMVKSSISNFIKKNPLKSDKSIQTLPKVIKVVNLKNKHVSIFTSFAQTFLFWKILFCLFITKWFFLTSMM